MKIQKKSCIFNISDWLYLVTQGGNTGDGSVC